MKTIRYEVQEAQTKDGATEYVTVFTTNVLARANERLAESRVAARITRIETLEKVVDCNSL